MHSGRGMPAGNFTGIDIRIHWSRLMQPSKHRIVSRVAILAVLASVCTIAPAADAPVSREVQNLIDFQCHGAKTLKQAQANYADMARGYTDQHPVMICLKKKIEELKVAGK